MIFWVEHLGPIKYTIVAFTAECIIDTDILYHVQGPGERILIRREVLKKPLVFPYRCLNCAVICHQ